MRISQRKQTNCETQITGIANGSVQCFQCVGVAQVVARSIEYGSHLGCLAHIHLLQRGLDGGALENVLLFLCVASEKYTETPSIVYQWVHLR